MGQPIDQEALQSVLLTMDQVNQMNPAPADTVTADGMLTEQSAG